MKKPLEGKTRNYISKEETMKRTTTESKGRAFHMRFSMILTAAVVLTALLFAPAVYSADNFAVKSAGGPPCLP